MESAIVGLMRTCFAALFLMAACASIARAAPVASDRPAEVAPVPEGGFSWQGQVYTVPELGKALRLAKPSESITSVVMLGDDATVQDVIDIAALSHAAGLPAFYRLNGKRHRIEVSE